MVKLHVFFVTLVIVATTDANLLSYDVVEDLFKKFVKNALSKKEDKRLQDLFEILRRPSYTRSALVNSTRATLDCWLCRSAFAAFIKGVRSGLTHNMLKRPMTYLCAYLGFESNTVCQGAVDLNMPILTHIVKTTPEVTSRTICGLILQDEPGPNACAVEDPRFEWQVDLPEKTRIQTMPPTNDKPLTIALISDAHIDPLYEPYGAAECDQHVCCRRGQNLTLDTPKYRFRANIDELVYEETIVRTDDGIKIDLSVAPKLREMRRLAQRRFKRAKDPEPAGYWGDYRNCDTPLWAFDDVVDRISQTHKNIDIVYYIGDTIDHFVWETTHELVNNMTRHVVDKLKNSFGDEVLVIPVIGNHDSQPTNMFAPANVTGENLNSTWLYKAWADKWDFYLPDAAMTSVLERGEYSVLAKPGLRVITLNNNVVFRFNWWLVYDPLDAKKHLQWLVEELHQAELAGEKVHIVTHIPSGLSDLTLTWTREYNRIINRFASTISGEFNGHTHSDEFKIFYSPDGTPVCVAWGAGGITPYANNNLNYKIVTLDAATYEPININNYVYNLTKANLTPNKRPHWFKLYDFKQKFKLPDLSPASMDNLVTSMATTNPELLDLYVEYFSKKSHVNWQNCDIECKMDHLCKTVITVLWQRQKCDELRKLYLATIEDISD
ncbi:sphingomyelin phosphodiesterase 1-like [Choristoneura fumiferana]|uniref:sphingomyelin phosphodiesterase 1-like n=1 Tax=Choristoneura fumiferana TaxID=7141 RepID=UPI003D15C258